MRNRLSKFQFYCWIEAGNTPNLNIYIIMNTCDWFLLRNGWKAKKKNSSSHTIYSIVRKWDFVVLTFLEDLFFLAKPPQIEWVAKWETKFRNAQSSTITKRNSNNNNKKTLYLQSLLTWLHLKLQASNHIQNWVATEPNIYLKHVYLSFCMEIGDDVCVQMCFHLQYFSNVFVPSPFRLKSLHFSIICVKCVFYSHSDEYSILTHDYFFSVVALTVPKIHSPETFYSIIFVKSFRHGWELRELPELPLKRFMNKIQILLFGNANRKIIYWLYDANKCKHEHFFNNTYNCYEYCGFWIGKTHNIPSSNVYVNK